MGAPRKALVSSSISAARCQPVELKPAIGQVLEKLGGVVVGSGVRITPCPLAKQDQTLGAIHVDDAEG
jgi:hypothetical protein